MGLVKALDPPYNFGKRRTAKIERRGGFSRSKSMPAILPNGAEGVNLFPLVSISLRFRERN